MPFATQAFLAGPRMSGGGEFFDRLGQPRAPRQSEALSSRRDSRALKKLPSELTKHEEIRGSRKPRPVNSPGSANSLI
jgi:hypothetical protein